MGTFKENIQQLIDPWLFMYLSFTHIPMTVREIWTSRQWSAFFFPSVFSEVLFGNFWAFVGPQVKERAEERVIPLLEGRVSDGRVHDHAVGEPVGGMVLEIGAGSGMWADVFAKIDTASGSGSASPAGNATRRRTRSSAVGAAAPAAAGITKIYGVEPNKKSFEALTQRVKDVGLADVYEAAPVGIESLSDPTAWHGKVEPGTVDSIVTVLCLCSIPEQQKNIKLLYDLLKPGGRWYFYEHVQVEPARPLLRLYQRIVNIPWSFFLGSCRLCRSTGENLRNAGPWSKIDLERPENSPAYGVLPHVIGTLTK